MEQKRLLQAGLYGTEEAPPGRSIWNRRGSSRQVYMEQKRLLQAGLYGTEEAPPIIIPYI